MSCVFLLFFFIYIYIYNVCLYISTFFLLNIYFYIKIVQPAVCRVYVMHTPVYCTCTGRKNCLQNIVPSKWNRIFKKAYVGKEIQKGKLGRNLKVLKVA